MIRRGFGIVFAIILLIVGIYQFAEGSAQKAEYDDFMAKAVSVTAVCTEVWDYESTDEDGYTTSNTFANASYEYNGEEYTAKSLQVSFTKKEGDTVTLYINPDNPADSRQELKSGGFELELTVARVFIGVGTGLLLLYIVLGIISFVFRIVRRR